jgi:PAS domain S-box-containing protein
MAPDLEDLQAMWLDLNAHVERLANERQQYVDFFEQASEAYVVTDAHGTIAQANGAAVDILHRRKRELRGKPLTTFIALDQRGDFRRRLRALADGQTVPCPWRTIVVAAGERTAIALSARVMDRADAGICWRLDTVP